MVFTLVNPTVPPSGSVPTLKATPDGRSLNLVFSDDFRSFRVWDGRSGIWQTTPSGQFQFGRRQGGADRTLDVGEGDAPDPVALGAVGLEISAMPASKKSDATPGTGSYPYLSGLISTQPSFSQTYGYFEMRAELPQGKGLWPAFWMLPEDGTWPPELDVVESIGDPSRVYMTAHSGVSKTVGAETRVTPGTSHTFAVSWDPRELIWYVDAAEAGRALTPDDMHKPMFMLVNLAVGGTWSGLPDATPPFPSKLMVEYIRAYQFEP